MTSDGDIVNKILRAENAHDKEYIVKVDKPISERFVERMSKGVPILGTITKPCIVKHESKYVFRIILTQGLNRQIRRMCEYLDYEVIELQRSRIMNVELGNLRSGEWRDLTTSEMVEINTAVAGSRKTALGDDFTAAEITDTEIIDDDLAAVEVNAEVEKVAITEIKHASKTIVSKSPAASRTLTRIDVKKPTTTSLGKKRLSLKKKS